MSKYRKSWTQAMQEVQESAALQLKMAFDDAKIKIKGVKGGKLVIDKKDKKKVEKVIAKQMKKPSDAKRVLGSQIVFEEAEIDEGNKSKDIANMYALISKALKAISGSKKQTEIIKQLNDVRKKLGMPPLKTTDIKEPKRVTPGGKFEEVELAEKGTAYPATVDTLKQIVKDKQHQTVMFDKGSAKVDLFTASAMLTVYKALKQPHLKKKFEDMIKSKEGFMQTQAFAMKMAK